MATIITEGGGVSTISAGYYYGGGLPSRGRVIRRRRRSGSSSRRVSSAYGQTEEDLRRLREQEQAQAQEEARQREDERRQNLIKAQEEQQQRKDIIQLITEKREQERVSQLQSRKDNVTIINGYRVEQPTTDAKETQLKKKYPDMTPNYGMGRIDLQTQDNLFSKYRDAVNTVISFTGGKKAGPEYYLKQDKVEKIQVTASNINKTFNKSTQKVIDYYVTPTVQKLTGAKTIREYKKKAITTTEGLERLGVPKAFTRKVEFVAGVGSGVAEDVYKKPSKNISLFSAGLITGTVFTTGKVATKLVAGVKGVKVFTTGERVLAGTYLLNRFDRYLSANKNVRALESGAKFGVTVKDIGVFGLGFKGGSKLVTRVTAQVGKAEAKRIKRLEKLPSQSTIKVRENTFRKVDIKTDGVVKIKTVTKGNIIKTGGKSAVIVGEAQKTIRTGGFLRSKQYTPITAKARQDILLTSKVKTGKGFVGLTYSKNYRPGKLTGSIVTKYNNRRYKFTTGIKTNTDYITISKGNLYILKKGDPKKFIFIRDKRGQLLPPSQKLYTPQVSPKTLSISPYTTTITPTFKTTSLSSPTVKSSMLPLSINTNTGVTPTTLYRDLTRTRNDTRLNPLSRLNNAQSLVNTTITTPTTTTTTTTSQVSLLRQSPATVTTITPTTTITPVTPSYRFPNTTQEPPFYFDYNLKRRKKKKKRGITYTPKEDLAVSYGFTAKALGLKPIKVKKTQVKERGKALGIRREIVA